MFKISSTTDKINNIGGLALAGELFNCFDLENRFEFREIGKRRDRVADSDIVKTMMGLFVQGRSDYEDIELFRDDPLFGPALGLKKVVSCSALRNRLGELGEVSGCQGRLREANTQFLKNTKLDSVDTGSRQFIPVDADVSPFDNSRSSKEGVGRTYKGCDGYAPIFAYVGTQGYLLDCQLRKGVQHSQKNAPDFFRGCIDKLEDLGILSDCLFRLDSAHDAADNIDIFRDRCDFVIKRNLRKESKEWWLDYARQVGVSTQPRDGKIIYTGTLEHLHPGGDETRAPLPVVFRVTVRTSDAKGEAFLFDKIEVDTWWTSLGEPAETVIRLYEAHGTSEQFHSELKTDMNLERFPSGTFKTNALLLLLGMMAYNTLRFIDQTMLKYRNLMPINKKVARRRVGSIIRDIIFVGCKLVTHSKRAFIKIWDGNPWLPAFRTVYADLCCRQ